MEGLGDTAADYQSRFDALVPAGAITLGWRLVYRAGGYGAWGTSYIDPLREPILTYPVLHYQNGGLVIDERAETTLEGLFACGEIAGGTHGRNRMMGNSLLECTVFGRRAGAAAAEKVAA